MHRAALAHMASDQRVGSQLGNFLQLFSHVSLVNIGYALCTGSVDA